MYANTNFGIQVSFGGGVKIVNNTVYEPVGDAVRVENGCVDVELRNNILWVEDGYDISMDSDSQNSFSSDHNLLYTTGSGQVGFWQGLARSTLSEWQSTTLIDQNSISQDPLFIDPDGADDQLGYASPMKDGRDDDFHLQSTTPDGSYHGGTLAPVLDPVSGLPAAQTGTWTVDGAHSSAIDRGDPADAYSNETNPERRLRQSGRLRQYRPGFSQP